MNERNDYYELQLIGLIRTNNNTYISELLELYYEEENGESDWVRLLTDVSATQNPHLKIFVEEFDNGECPTIYFDTLKGLREIKAVRFSALVYDDNQKDLMHIIRKTIETTFAEGESKKYQIGAMLQPPFLKLENETSQELIARSTKELAKSNAALFFEYTKGNYAELDELKDGKCVRKTYVPLNEAERLLEKQFPGILEIFKNEGIKRWNYVDHCKNHECHPEKQNNNQGNIHVNML